jgi:ubiquinone/menaquinone biosynthesis C-methylase UbiE
MSQQVYNDAAASGYNRAFAQVSSHFAAALIGAVDLSAGENVLDIATGTGMAAAIALTAVGAKGNVTAADISPAMVKQARDRLGDAPNAFFSVEDGQAEVVPENRTGV